MGLGQIREVLSQAETIGAVEWIFFEGGEPFLYYPLLTQGAAEAADRGFRVGVVTNGYWATGAEDALMWLRPLAGLIQALSVSRDLYHDDDALSRRARNAHQAARQLGIPASTISVAQPEEENGSLASLMFRGRAAEKLAPRAIHHPWETFTECPYETLRDPGRVHVDPFGNTHLCQGISLGSLFHTPLTDLWTAYDPEAHPIVGPLLDGGPAELARRYDIACQKTYADACHLCYEARLSLRQRFPAILTPGQVYGVFEG
jgi:MoaA/NifB/PqqE/SkfB family radical SAM enzyme